MTVNGVPAITHVIYRLAVGGLENGLVNLINGLPADKFRHAIICIDESTDFRRRIQRNDVEIVEIRKKQGRDPAAFWRLYKTIRRIRPDIIHTRNLGAMDALLPAAIAGVRYRIHGEHGWDVTDLQGSSNKYRILRKIYSPLITHYVTVSKDLHDYLVNRVHINELRITQICNGVDTDKFSPVSAGLHDRSSYCPMFTKDVRIVGTVGRMESVKDHLNLANAFIKLVQDNPECSHIRLAIVGDGEQRLAVEQRLKAAGLEKYCWLPGNRNDIPALIRCFDVFVQSSLAEGISNTVLEAMASGVPVVATDVGGNAELVDHDRTGVIVPPADNESLVSALYEYITNEPRRLAHGVAGRKRAVNMFSIKKMRDQYRALYDAISGQVST